jgi:hypothetical protein
MSPDDSRPRDETASLAGLCGGKNADSGTGEGEGAEHTLKFDATYAAVPFGASSRAGPYSR